MAKKKEEGVIAEGVAAAAPEAEAPAKPKKPCKFLAGKLVDGKYRIVKSTVEDNGSVVRFKTEHGSGYALPREEYDAL